MGASVESFVHLTGSGAQATASANATNGKVRVGCAVRGARVAYEKCGGGSFMLGAAMRPGSGASSPAYMLECPPLLARLDKL